MAGRNKDNPRSAGPVDKKIGERIRARRHEIGMSQEVLAGKLGITFQQIQKYEKGVNRVAASTLLELADALKTPVHSLLPAERMDVGAGQREGPETGAILVLLAELNADGRRALASIARTFVRDPKLGRGRKD